MSPEQGTTPTVHGDNEVITENDDFLLFKDDYVPGLLERVQHADTPFVLGIYGGWGVGKSSLMRLLREKVEKAGHPTVWCNPWKYDQRGEVGKALIREVYRAVHRAVGFLELARQQGGRVVLKTAKQAADMVGRIIGVGETGHELEAMFALDPTFSNVFEREFDRQLRYLHKQLDDDKRLVIFVDDLDRCSPPAVIEVLEALKLYLGRQGCVFVLGADPSFVQDAVETKYPSVTKDKGKDEQQEQAAGPPVGQRYLEKIVQLPFYIPPHSEDRLKELLERLNVKDQLPRDIGEDKAEEWVEYVRRVGEATGNNPRQIKRFINTVHLIARIAPNEVQSPREDEEMMALDRFRLAKVVLLQFAFEEFYRLVGRYHSLLYTGQQRALVLKERGEPAEVSEGEEHRGRPRTGEDEDEQKFALVDRNPDLQQVLREPPFWESAEEAGCYITYSGGGTPTVAAPVFAAIHEDLLSPDDSVVVAAADKVKEQGAEAVEAHASALRDRLADKSADRRDDAAYALGEIGDNRAVQFLIAAVRDEDWAVRWYAATALGKIGDERSVEPLIDVMQDQEEPISTRWTAARALGPIGDERAVPPLIGVMQDPEEREPVRDGAWGTLKMIGTPEALEAAEKYRREVEGGE